MSRIKKLVTGALCAALCVVLPLAFHALPDGGRIFSPIHIPVLLCGLLCGPLTGMICGIVGAGLSSAITGMPPLAYLPPMLIELAVYGLCTGLLMRFVRSGRLSADIYISLISSMLLGRMVAGLAEAAIFTRGGITLAMWASSYFAAGIPGIIVHLIVVPILVLALMKAGLVPPRYSKEMKK